MSQRYTICVDDGEIVFNHQKCARLFHVIHVGCSGSFEDYSRCTLTRFCRLDRRCALRNCSMQLLQSVQRATTFARCAIRRWSDALCQVVFRFRTWQQVETDSEQRRYDLCFITRTDIQRIVFCQRKSKRSDNLLHALHALTRDVFGTERVVKHLDRNPAVVVHIMQCFENGFEVCVTHSRT